MATKERRSTGRGVDRRTRERTPQRDATAPAGSGVERKPDSGARRRSSAAVPQPPNDTGDRRRDEIARAAYHKAEKRGFAGNREVEDWLEAEREIDSRTAGAGIQHEASVLAEGAGDVTAPAIEEVRKSDGELIDPEDLQSWAKKLKVPAPRLREAIQRVGPRLSEIERFLGSAQQGG